MSYRTYSVFHFIKVFFRVSSRCVELLNQVLNLLFKFQVIEEVESHLVVSLCPKLEYLVLSGCGFISPVTCGSYMCADKPRYLRKLKLLFYADGDDFSWTHNVPQCFWKATLSSSMYFNLYLKQKHKLYDQNTFWRYQVRALIFKVSPPQIDKGLLGQIGKPLLLHLASALVTTKNLIF